MAWQGRHAARRLGFQGFAWSQTMETIAKPKGYGACPSHFRAACRQGSRGGADGYEKAGYHLIMHIGSLAPYEIEEEDWDRHLQDLADLNLTTSEDGRMLVSPDDDAVVAWFDRRVPRCMALVPRRRRGALLSGVYRYVL